MAIIGPTGNYHLLLVLPDPAPGDPLFLDPPLIIHTNSATSNPPAAKTADRSSSSNSITIEIGLVLPQTLVVRLEDIQTLDLTVVSLIYMK